MGVGVVWGGGNKNEVAYWIELTFEEVEVNLVRINGLFWRPVLRMKAWI